MISAAVKGHAERPEQAIKANAAPGTLFTMGRSARSSWCLWPATQRATPMVLGARARWSECIVTRNNERKTRTRLSHPSRGVSPRPDGIGRGLSGLLLPLLARARHLLMQEIFSQPAHVCQDPPRCMSDVFQSFALRFIVHGSHHASGVLKCPTKPLNGLSR